MIGRVRILLVFASILVIWKLFQYFLVFKVNSDTNDANLRIIDASTPFEKIKVSLYYEALCSDSRNFILDQLVPSYEKLHNYLELDLVPYGRATTIENNGDYTFHCQHGVTECVANKVHACVLVNIKDSKEQLEYVACMISDNLIPEEIAKKCLKNSNISYDVISECANGKQASILLREHGKRTDAVTPKITFIPTIELNGEQKVPLVSILKDFKKEVCNLFTTRPQECL